jgi:hypothetical protein
MARRTHQLRTIVLGDRPEAWAAAGFAVSEPGTVTLGSTTVRLDSSGDGFVAWHLDDVDVDADLDGLVSTAIVAAPGATDHPNGIASIDHVVVRTGDTDRTVAAFGAVGLHPRGERATASYGAPMRQVFFWAGDVIVELIGPDEGEPTTDEPASVFGLALSATDLDATAAHLGDLLGTPKDAVQPGRRIAGLRGRQVGISLPIAVMSPHVRAGRGEHDGAAGG